MSEQKHRQIEADGDGHDGHDGNDNEDRGHNIHGQREPAHYVHDMLRSLEAITAGRS